MRDEMIGNFTDLDAFDRYLYTIITDKVEGYAYNKMRSVGVREGILGYSVLYRWYTEISGLGLTEQAQKLMRPESPKKEEDMAEKYRLLA